MHGDPYGGVRHYEKASFQLQGTKVPFVSRSLGSTRLHEIASGLNNKSRIDLTEVDSDTDVPEMQLGGIVEVIHLPKIIQIQVYSTPDSNPELLHQT